MLDHDRRVTERVVLEALASLVLVELLVVRLAFEEEVDELATSVLRRNVEVQALVEPARPQQRWVEVIRAVGCGDQEDVVVARLRSGEAPVRRKVVVDHLDEAGPDAVAKWRLIERLHLDQQLVHHAGAAGPDDVRRNSSEACRVWARVQAASIGADRVDLLDEADGPALLARELSKPAEERADPGGGHPEPHRLERRTGDEQERHARLLGHRLGQVRLAGSRRALEQDPSTGVPAELVSACGVPEEHVESPAHLVDLVVESANLVQPDLDLFGSNDRVW